MDGKQARTPTAVFGLIAAILAGSRYGRHIRLRRRADRAQSRGAARRRGGVDLPEPPAVDRTAAPIGPGDLHGHVILLNIWGWWCGYCRAELPHMAELRQRFAGQTAFRLAAVSYPSGDSVSNVESLREQTADLLKRLDVDLPTYYDPEGKTLDAMKAVTDFAGFPTTLLLDRHGVIRAIWKGYGPGVENRDGAVYFPGFGGGAGERMRDQG